MPDSTFATQQILPENKNENDIISKCNHPQRKGMNSEVYERKKDKLHMQCQTSFVGAKNISARKEGKCCNKGWISFSDHDAQSSSQLQKKGGSTILAWMKFFYLQTPSM